MSKKPAVKANNNTAVTRMMGGLTKLELCHMLIQALQITAGQAKMLTSADLDDMPLAKAILVKSLIKSYETSDFTLPMAIFSKIFGQSEEWGTEYLRALKAAKEVSIDQQISNLKTFIKSLETKEAVNNMSNRNG